MKTKLLIFALLLISATVFSQSNIEMVKEKTPDVYNEIKSCAINKWIDDYAMIKYEIGKQCDAIVSITKYIADKTDNSIEFTTMINALTKWTENNCPDYVMAVYEYKKQIKAYYEL